MGGLLATGGVAQITELHVCENSVYYEDPDPISNEHLGASVAVNGDFNGDNHLDLVIGGTTKPVVPDFDENTTRAILYLGTSSGPATTGAISFQGNGTRDQFGTGVSFIPSMNGDSYDELLIAAPNWDGQYTRLGAVYIYLGRSGLPTTMPLTGQDSSICITGGNCYGSRFGDGFAVGDIDADGVADLIIGAPGSDMTDGSDYPGSVYVFLGGHNSALSVAIAAASSSTSGTPIDLSSDDADITIVGYADADRFGQSVAIIGTGINGTSGTAFAVGAPQIKMDTGAPRAAVHAGYVRLFSHDGTPITGASPLPADFAGTQPRIMYQGPAAYPDPPPPPVLVSDGEAFGFSVSGGVDINADGVNEIIIGAILYDRDFNENAHVPSALVNAGAVHVFSGLDLGRLFTGASGETTAIWGEAADDFFGSSVLGIPSLAGTDFFPDTVPDLLVGAYHYGTGGGAYYAPCDLNQGAARSGAFYVTSGATGESRYRIIGESLNDSLGFDVAAGYLDSVSGLDILSGSLGWSLPAPPTETGRTYLYKNLTP